MIVSYKSCLAIAGDSDEDGWCDNDYFYDNGSCVSCPNTFLFMSEDGSVIEGASSGCGIGNEADYYKDITTCRIYSDDSQDGTGEPCIYSDTIGSFYLGEDCVYAE